MQQTRWQKIERIFNEAVALAPDEREAFVAGHCGDDDELCREIVALLFADSQDEDFLSEPLFEDGLRLIDSDFAGLLEEDEFDRYKIRKLLGRGGMGAVFLARDIGLGRDVALKILPPRFAESLQSVERFRQEARAASAVSHPNVAHIYEFGESNGRYFLAMEYVEGKTLRERLKMKEITPSRAIEIVGQIAQAIEKMHRSGIIHRDIKPENIIIDERGQVKVLDFGLAKFSPEKRANSLETSMETLPGIVLGTSAYMSPEQVRGQSADERTDIWSLAVMFYEMLFGARPFAGETASDIRAAILRDEPPLEGLSAALRKFFSKALEKNPDRRFQSITEFADELEQLEKSNLKSNLKRILSPKPSAPGNSGLTLLIGALLAIAAAATIGYFVWTRAVAPPKNAFLTAAKRLTNSGKVKYTTLTADGEMFAYSLEELGGRSIYLARRNPQTGEYDAPPQTLLAANKNIVSQLAFSPDKRYLYFKMRESGKTIGSLYRLSIDDAPAAASEKILDDIQGAPTFSPDGKTIAFLRLSRDNSHETILLADAETGGGERVLYTRARPEFIPDTAQPAWSPDGQTILCAGGVYRDDAESYTVLAIDAQTGAARAILNDFWAEIWATVWTQNGGGLVFAGHKEKLADNNQLWGVSYPSGEVRRLTDDYNDYFTIAAARAKNSGETDLVSIILQRRAQIYRAELNSPAATAVLLTPEGDYGYGISITADGRIFYGSTKSGNPDIWTMNRDGAEQRQLTFDPKLDSQPYAAGRGEYVVFGSYRSGTEALWRMKPDGSEQTLLASNIVRDSLAVSPDGRFIYYRSNAKGAEAVFRVSIDGGEPQKFVEGNYKSLAVSPDGQMLAATLEEDDNEEPRLAVMQIANPTQKPRIYPLADGALPLEKIRFTPDGVAVAYIAVQKGVGNLWAQKLGETKPQPLTDFKTDALYSFDFSPDGREVFCSRGELNGYAVRFTLTKE